MIKINLNFFVDQPQILKKFLKNKNKNFSQILNNFTNVLKKP
jgi:hypothetical protein